MNLLGSFLEISISTENILSDIAWFEQFDFQQLKVNDTLTHQYGVVGNGDINFGLHHYTFSSPSLAFVLPDLSKNIGRLRDLDVEFEFTNLSDEDFNEAGFLDESGQRITLLEARTFSPFLMDEEMQCAFGTFSHLVVPDIHGNSDFWQQFCEEENTPQSRKIEINSGYSQLTAVFKCDLENIVRRGATEGWKNFSVTQENDGLIKSPFGIDFIVKDST